VEFPDFSDDSFEGCHTPEGGEARFDSAVVVVAEGECTDGELVLLRRTDASDYATGVPAVGEKAGERVLRLAGNVEKCFVSRISFVFVDRVVCNYDESLATGAEFREEVFHQLRKLTPVLNAHGLEVSCVFG